MKNNNILTTLAFLPSSVVLFTSVFLTACSINADSQKVDNVETACTEPRPQICTNEYLPVCGTKQDGSIKTYATACTACSDKQVISHHKNACDK